MPARPGIAAARRRVRSRIDGAVRAVVRPRGRERVTGVVESLEDYIAARPARGDFELVHAATDVQRPAPRSIDAEVHPTLAALRTHRHPATFRARLPGARIAGVEPLVLTADRQALLQSTFDREQL